MKILTKLFDALLNPSKKIRHMLRPKNKHQDIDYVLGKKIKSLQTEKANKEILKATTYRSVFIKFFIVTTITFLTALIIYFKFDSPESIFKFIKEYNLPDYGSPHAENYKSRLVSDYVVFVYLISISFGCICWAIGFYLYNPFLKFATFILSFCLGCFMGSIFFTLNFYSNIKGIAALIPSIITITFLTTIFIIISISCLYYAKKILVTPQVRNFTVMFCLFTYLSSSFIILFKIFSRNHFDFKNNWWYLLLVLLLTIAQLIVGALTWVVTLNSVDLFVEQKIPQKYEWLLISVLVLVLIQIFFSILQIIVIIMRMLKLTNKK
ncbi:Bax inhibitor-1 [Candidatus Phytoplasma solani]|uniref:Bax inhibitor-1/YccA family membrane protein n=1 Tax=Candidatus Phytoplasma solani TaxID=69896 RepID=UPI0032DBAC7C